MSGLSGRDYPFTGKKTQKFRKRNGQKTLQSGIKALSKNTRKLYENSSDY